MTPAAGTTSIAMRSWRNCDRSPQRLWLDRRLAVARNGLGQHEQFVGLAQHDAPPPALDQPALLPAGEDAAHRMQRGAGHLGYVLAADRKVDFDAVFHLAPGLLGKPQQGVRNELLHMLCRYLD